MKISLDWLKLFVDVDLSPRELAEVLTGIGLLTEEWEEKNGDVIFEVETYANRPDTLGHTGVARELAAALGLQLKKQAWTITEIEERAEDLVDIQILDSDLCPRYTGMIVKDVSVGPSPEWLSSRVEAMGLKSINNVVDVTNYVLFATSHPIHAFDFSKIAGKKIIVRRAKNGERLRSLEDEWVELTPEMLVIADEERPVALAGVIGGAESAVTETTREVFIESAYFDPVSVRRTSKATGVQTDASYRFERGADVSFPPRAALMAASLLAQFGGKVCQGIVDVYPKPQRTKTLMLRGHRVTSLLGVEVEGGFIEQTLTRLGFQTETKQPGIWKIKCPSFRVDIGREADLIEEIARFYGYERIPSMVPPLRSVELARDPLRERLDRLREALFHQGFDEVVNFSFMAPEKEAVFHRGVRPIPIRNPISARASLLRTTILGGLLENIAWNVNRGAEGVQVFELGKIFSLIGDEYREQRALGLAGSGRVGELHWRKKRRPADFFLLKGACEAFLARLRYDDYVFKVVEHPFFRQGYSLELDVRGEPVGNLGLLRKEIQEAFGLKQDVWAAEINLDHLFVKQPRPFRYQPVAKFPSVSRDVSFIGGEEVPFAEVNTTVEKLRLPYLEKFFLYDRFSGSSVPRGKVSLSFRFVFRHPRRTLQAAEVDALMEKVVATLKTHHDFVLREGGKIDN